MLLIIHSKVAVNRSKLHLPFQLTFFAIYAITVGAKKENNGIFLTIVKAIAAINRIFQTMFGKRGTCRS